MNKSPHLSLGLALGLSACAPGGSSSTGVGNPGVISLSIVLDDEPSALPDGMGGANGEGGAATDVPHDDGGAVAVGGASCASPGAADAGTSGTETDADDLPRASVEHAVIVLGYLSWLPCDTTLEPTNLSGPFIIDLLGNLIPERTRPPIPDVVEPEGGFCGLEAPLAPAAAPAELAGRSVFFDGVRSDGTRFVLYANVSAKLRVRRHHLIVWNAEATPAVLWAFRPRRWLSRKDLDQTPPMPWDGASSGVVVDVNRHPLLLDALRHRLAGKSSLLLDLNQNRQLDADDRDALIGDGSEDPD